MPTTIAGLLKITEKGLVVANDADPELLTVGSRWKHKSLGCIATVTGVSPLVTYQIEKEPFARSPAAFLARYVPYGDQPAAPLKTGTHIFDIHRRDLHFCSRCGFCIWAQREIDVEKDACPLVALPENAVRNSIEMLISSRMYFENVDYGREKLNQWLARQNKAMRERYTSLSPALRLVGGWNRR